MISHALLATLVAITPPQKNHAAVRLLVGPTVGDSTSDRWMGLELTLTPGWHVYWRNPGDAGSPPSASWTLPAGWTFGALEFPRPRRIEVPPLTAFGYVGRVVYPFRLRMSAGANHDVGRVLGQLSWVACEVACIAEQDSVRLDVRPNDASPRDGALVAQAVTELPRPLPSTWIVAARAEAGGIALVVRASRSTKGMSGDFFPLDAGVLEHSAKVAVTADGDSLALRLTPSRYATGLPDTLAGLLVLTTVGDTAGSYDVRLPVARAGRHAAVTTSATAPFALLALALVSGVLVNLMPCVFPLLAVKALSFVTGTTTRVDRVRRALAYSAGSVTSCVVLGAALVFTRAGDSAWGFQMQSPRFLGAIALISFTAALNLLGVFEVPSLVPSSATARVNQLGAHVGAFAAGAVAILVGAPCTAPFFGAMVAGVLAAPSATALATLGVFGLGAALPVAAFTLSPSLVRRLPKPGRWMETVRQLLAFPLLAAAVWLVWVASVQTGPAGYAALLTSLLAFGFSAWVLGRWATVVAMARTRRIALVIAGIAMVLGVTGVASLEAIASRPREDTAVLHWQPYSDQRLDSLRAAGRPVLVDFTAAWCLTCKVNEVRALSSPRVAEDVRARSVGLLRADLTVADTALTRALHAVGAASVPTYAMYSATGGEPSLLPPLLTTRAVTDAIARAVRATSVASQSHP